MSVDLILRGGTVVDGTGAPGRVADVAIDKGRIVGIGKCTESAAAERDVTGLVVSPGFVDVHTHYDAQVRWDPSLKPSSLQGVTSLTGGNCGFSLAPIPPSDREYFATMMSKVEGIPLESLNAGVDWSWTTFAEYLDALEGTLGVNAGFHVGHSPIRRAVMGEAAMEGAATEDQIVQMQQLLREGLRAGGLGFSSSRSTTHVDFDGEAVPSRHADPSEVVKLASVLRDFPGTNLGIVLSSPRPYEWSDEQRQMLVDMSIAAQRPLNWNALINVRPTQAPLIDTILEMSDEAWRGGGQILGLSLPYSQKLYLNFAVGSFSTMFPGESIWQDFLLRMDHAQRRQALLDPSMREKLGRDADANPLRSTLLNWEKATVTSAAEARNKHLTGRTFEEIGRERGTTAFEAVLDLVHDEDLATIIGLPGYDLADEDQQYKVDLLRNPRVLLGATDSGAHLDFFYESNVATTVLQDLVRERQLLSLEEAIHQLTAIPAAYLGLTNRGQLREGYAADIVMFDPDTVGYGPLHAVYDLPGGASRLYQDPVGIESVYVNGIEAVRTGELTGAAPGKVLRGGQDTHTPTLGGPLQCP